MSILNQRKERIKIFLDKGYIVDIETGKVFNSRGKECGCLVKGYIHLQTTLDKKLIQLKVHQLIFYVATGEVVEQIDHINGDRSDNRIENLRSVTHQQNQHNQTKAKGYCWFNKRNRWGARIRLDGKSIHLGYFIKEEDARQAYLDAKKIYHKI